METLTKYWINWFCAIIAGLLSLVWKRVKQLKKENDANKSGTIALLHNELVKNYNEYKVQKGYMPIWAKENVEMIYKSYHSLGGNGTGTQLYNEMMALPTE